MNTGVKIAQYTIGGKFIRTFNSIYEAEITLSLNSIQQAIRKNGMCGGYQWRVYNGSDEDIKPLINNKTKCRYYPIKMIDKDGNETTFSSIAECAEKTGLDSRQIIKVVKNVIRTHRGFRFSYI